MPCTRQACVWAGASRCGHCTSNGHSAYSEPLPALWGPFLRAPQGMESLWGSFSFSPSPTHTLVESFRGPHEELCNCTNGLRHAHAHAHAYADPLPHRLARGSAPGWSIPLSSMFVQAGRVRQPPFPKDDISIPQSHYVEASLDRARQYNPITRIQSVPCLSLRQVWGWFGHIRRKLTIP